MNPRQDTTYELPDELPPDTICVQIQIPKGAYYARQFYGAIEQLSYWFAYDSDHDRTGAKVAKLWKAALRTIAACPDQQIINPCGCGDDCMCNQLRFHNCVLQQFDCLTQMWIDVPSDEDCVPNTAPGGGITPPIAGACQDYTIALQANALTLMPFVVNAGDTIQLEAVTGAGTDGTPNWYCADGELYLLGGCAGGGGTNSGDPLPATKHMALLWKIGSNYYPINSTLFTVPGGVTNAQIWIQVNDSSLADDSGTYNIKFNYCNHQTPPTLTWCHAANFALTPDGFSPVIITPGTQPCNDTPTFGASWVGGVGFEELRALQDDCSDHNVFDYVQLDLGAAAVMTDIEVTGEFAAAGAFAVFGANVLTSNDPTFATAVNWGSMFSAPGAFAFASTTGGTHRYIRIQATAAVASDPAGQLRYFTWKVKGTGTNPFGSSNC